MELAARLKEHRNRLGLSQEETAARIFVSRQTISNWETDRTYPDVQSLLLLSELFDTSIDELVKGDVETMEKTIGNDWKKMERLTAAGWALIVAGVAAFVAGIAAHTAPSSLVPYFTESELLGLVVFFGFWIAGMVLLVRVDRLKKKNDLVTYRDILAYSKGEEPARDSESFGRRYPWAAAALKLFVGLAVGLFVGIALMCFIDFLA